MAVWAARELLAGRPQDFAHLRARHLPGETDPDIRDEWRAGEALA
jgi:hypothetical protein